MLPDLWFTTLNVFDDLFPGRGNQKGGKNKRKNSRSGSTPTPPTPPPPQSVEEVKIAPPVVVAAAELPSPSQEKDVPAVSQVVAPIAVPSTPVPVVESSPKEPEIKVRLYYTV